MTIHDWQNAMDRAVRQEKQSYSGMMMPQIHAVVDNVLQMNSFRKYTLPDENAKICCQILEDGSVCGKSLGEHSFVEWRCPNQSYTGDLYHLKTFVESKVSQTCMAIIPTNSIATEGSPCGKPAVGNTEMCERHLAENGI